MTEQEVARLAHEVAGALSRVEGRYGDGSLPLYVIRAWQRALAGDDMPSAAELSEATGASRFAIYRVENRVLADLRRELHIEVAEQTGGRDGGLR